MASSSGSASDFSLDLLPVALLQTIMSKLDLPSLCSAAASCKTLNFCASQTLLFITNFHLLDIAPTVDMLERLLPPNPSLWSLKIDCSNLNDSSIVHLARPSLRDLYLHNCGRLSSKLLLELGRKCTDLRLIFDISTFGSRNFPEVLATASERLMVLEIGFAMSGMAKETFSRKSGVSQYPLSPSVFPCLQKLCLGVDIITDSLICTISRSLVSLTHLDLHDAPFVEPLAPFDLTNMGMQQINPYKKLKHLSLVRSQEFAPAYFRRVNDLGVLLMVEACADYESIYLGGFSRITDTGLRAILHSCPKLHKVKVWNGTRLTDLVFHDISATPLALTHVGLRSCNLITNASIIQLASNRDLSTLDFRGCRGVGDRALNAICTLPKLKALLLDGCDISDVGLSYLGYGLTSLVSLSLRGCKRITDEGIPALFVGSLKQTIQVLDLSYISNVSDNGILSLVRSGVQIVELRVRGCPLIGDTSVMALASMRSESGGYGSSMQVLDLHNSGRITRLAVRWFKKPYFPRLRWLGLTGGVHQDLVDSLKISRPFLRVALGEELGAGQWDPWDGLHSDELEEVDELEQWLLDVEGDED
ncbi:hypothetical protein AMTRI_Chr09g34910 [Amborella trichopoda]